MKPLNLAVIAVIAAVVIWLLIPGRYEHSVSFDGRELQHSESTDRGGLTSYFYTPTGGNPGAADEFIQLVVFDDDVSEDYRSAILDQTAGLFKLEPFGEDDSTYFGAIGDGGRRIYVYARDARGPGLDSIILYVTADEMDESEAGARADAYFRELAAIQAQDG